MARRTEYQSALRRGVCPDCRKPRFRGDGGLRSCCGICRERKNAESRALTATRTKAETPRRIHFCPFVNELVYGDEVNGELVLGELAENPHQLFLNALLSETASRIQELLDFGQRWEQQKAASFKKHERNRTRMRIHYDWIMDDDIHPNTFTMKELHEARQSQTHIDDARDRIFSRIPDAAMKELFRPFAPGAMRAAYKGYVANKLYTPRRPKSRGLTSRQGGLVSVA